MQLFLITNQFQVYLHNFCTYICICNIINLAFNICNLQAKLSSGVLVTVTVSPVSRISEFWTALKCEYRAKYVASLATTNLLSENILAKYIIFPGSRLEKGDKISSQKEDRLVYLA